jgi:hypothetical protein
MEVIFVLILERMKKDNTNFYKKKVESEELDVIGKMLQLGKEELKELVVEVVEEEEDLKKLNKRLNNPQKLPQLKLDKNIHNLKIIFYYIFF